ncbi:hypothetical protein GTA08_BOTSDO02941 [Botryosphaeria dothidea]|uniref:Uncharacterized protein n=1 Tax=Botryosphaeria dothidea TaxID=55169 RepID=A0A8H4N3H7_9PEZI|nr:hypothetical protein GTA08_BOTSDO02941 [Botryosphaeria dothidea]
MVKARWAYARSRGLGTTAPSVVIQLARAQPRRPGPAAPNANGLTTLPHTTPVMAAQQNGNAPQGSAGDADLAQVLPCTARCTSSFPQEAYLAQAFKDLARGEQTASALENHLDALEAKIEELLAAAGAQQNASPQTASGSPPQPANQDASGSSAGRES